MTEDGDEEESNSEAIGRHGETPKIQVSTKCPDGQFANKDGQCVCYEQGVNFVGHSVAKADDVETYQECQKLCESQNDCRYWTHYSGLSNFNTCFLKTKLGELSREIDNTGAVNYVSGSKSCRVPIIQGMSDF